jgi:hypothetical protein
VTQPAERTSKPGFVVFRQRDDDTWELVGEVPRRAGLPARRARAQAVLDATGGEAAAGARYAAVLRSEWRIALDH